MKSDKQKKIGQTVLAGLAILWATAKILSLILRYEEILREPDGLETVLLSVLITVVVFGIILAAVEKKRRKRLEDTKSTAYAGETAQAESTEKASNRFLNTGSIIKILIYVYVGLFLFIVSVGDVDPEDDIYVFSLMIIVTLIVLGLLRKKKTKASREQGERYRHTRTEAQEARYVKLRLVQRKLRGLRIATIVLFGVMMLIAFNISARYEETFYLVFGLIIFALIAIWIVMPIVQYRKVSAGFKQTEERPRAAADEGRREQSSSYPAESFDQNEYDRQKRLRQLDGFLENGLIDKEEYRRMKERYENL